MTATAAMCTMLVMSELLCKTWTGAPAPSSMGPMVTALPMVASNLLEI